MPLPELASSYNIVAPVGAQVPNDLRQRITSALTKIGAPTSDWRYVVLPDENWAQIKHAWGNVADDDFTNGVTINKAHVTYLKQSALQRMRDFELEGLLAHEYGHQYLNSSNETKVQDLANQLMNQIHKYGRSDLAAIQAGHSLSQQAREMFQPTQPNISLMLQK